LYFGGSKLKPLALPAAYLALGFTLGCLREVRFFFPFAFFSVFPNRENIEAIFFP
jgi:hypothetical protein